MESVSVKATLSTHVLSIFTINSRLDYLLSFVWMGLVKSGTESTFNINAVDLFVLNRLEPTGIVLRAAPTASMEENGNTKML